MQMRRGVVVLALSLLAAGCGGSSGGSTSAPPPSPSASPTPADDTAAKAQITTAWEAFYKGGSGTADDHIALLEDGEKFRAEITASQKDPANAGLSAKVTNVVVTPPTAAVTYNLLGKGGAALLTGAVGEAVQVGSTWKVSKKTYCQLIQLQNPSITHAGCG
jgi:hypothetical protein